VKMNFLEMGFKTVAGSWYPEIDGRSDGIYLKNYDHKNFVLYVFKHEFIHSLLRYALPIQEIAYRHKQNLALLSAFNKNNFYEYLQKIQVNCKIIEILTYLYEPIIEGFTTFLTDHFDFNTIAVILLGQNITTSTITERNYLRTLLETFYQENMDIGRLKKLIRSFIKSRKKFLSKDAENVHKTLERLYYELRSLNSLDDIRCAIIDILSDSFIYHVIGETQFLEKVSSSKIVDISKFSKERHDAISYLHLLKPFILENKERILKFIEEWIWDKRSLRISHNVRNERVVLPNLLTRDFWFFLENPYSCGDASEGIYIRRVVKAELLYELKKELDNDQISNSTSLDSISSITCSKAFNIANFKRSKARFKLKRMKLSDKALRSICINRLLELNKSFLLSRIAEGKKPMCLLRWLKAEYGNVHFFTSCQNRELICEECNATECLIGLDINKTSYGIPY